MKAAKLVVPGVLAAAHVVGSEAARQAVANQRGGRGSCAAALKAPSGSKKPGVFESAWTAVRVGARQGAEETLRDIQSPQAFRQRLYHDALQLGVSMTLNSVLSFVSKNQWDIDIPASDKAARPLGLPGGVKGRIGQEGGTISVFRGSKASGGKPSSVVFPPSVTVPNYVRTDGPWRFANRLADLEPRRVTADPTGQHGGILVRSFLRFPWGGKVEVPKPINLPKIPLGQFGRELAGTAVDLVKAGASVHGV